MKKSFFLIPILLLLLLVILPSLGFLLAGGDSGGGFSLAEPAYAAVSGTVMITGSDGNQLVVTQDTPE
ncbi:MAG: hypothetical protein K5707_04455, partial [Clostridia bacterium]|nr:hypothetical protein [Clostridia bacterium]